MNQTIVITNIDVEMQSVTYSPVTKTYGEPLLSNQLSYLELKVTSNAFTRHHENKADRAIE